MEQMTLFKPPYRYLIDASSIMAQKPTDVLPRQVHKSLWEMIEKCIEDRTIATCSEIEEEVKKDDVVGGWLSSKQCIILPIDDEVQRNVRRIVTEHPKMISFAGESGSSSGDAFLIATAMKYKLTIVTEENKDKQNKIPSISYWPVWEMGNWKNVGNQYGNQRVRYWFISWCIKLLF